MEQLFGTIGTHEATYLLARNSLTDAVTISVEPGNGKIPAGAVMYRKSGALYAPAADAQITTGNNLVVLRDDVDTTTSATVAVAAAAYRRAIFIAGRVLAKNGDAYVAVTAAQEIVLRQQGLELSPMDDWSGDATVADNGVSVSVTVTNDGHGTGAASPTGGVKGTIVTLTATPAANYAFDYWEIVEGDATVQDGKLTIGDFAPTVKAHFKSA